MALRQGIEMRMKWLVKAFCITFITVTLTGCDANPSFSEDLKTGTPPPTPITTVISTPVASLTPTVVLTPN
jgi:hypothetical protein